MGDDDSMAPRELNSVKEHKLTRRRVVELASAAGISTAVASHMTVDDVKASDSDQVTVSLDVDGKRKWTMDADRLDWVQRATRATENIRKNHVRKRGVFSVGMSGGDGEDNPHVVIKLNEKSDEKEERRGEIPEERNGVRVEFEEEEYDASLLCDTDCVPQEENFPGGQEILMGPGGDGTNSSQMIEDGYNWIGWTTAAHLLPDCSPQYDSIMHHAPDAGCEYRVGTVVSRDPYRDVAFITYDQAYDQSPSAWNRNPSNHNEGVLISSTLSEEGMIVIDEEYDGEDKIFMYGMESCLAVGELDSWNETYDISDLEGGCRDVLFDQMVVDYGCFGDSAAQGDSGGLFFTPDPQTDSWYALGSTVMGIETYSVCHQATGAQGFTIYDMYDRAWR